MKQLKDLWLTGEQHASIDTRTLKEGDVFFALKGPSFNGNEYAQGALINGAKLCVVDDPKLKDLPGMYYVADVLVAMQELANYYRNSQTWKVLALTGSNGKTTTKELLKEVLLKKYKVYATKGNLNNHIGVPLTLLNAPIDSEFLIIEMGANAKKEIAFLSNIVNPEFGLITNIGKAHLEGFGGEDGVLKGKSELYEYLIQNNGIAFVNQKDKKLMANLNPKLKRILTKDFTINFDSPLQVNVEELLLESNLVGSYNGENIAMAVTVGDYFGVTNRDMKLAIEDYVPDNNRSVRKLVNGYDVIFDAYNANPTSMKFSLHHFSNVKNEKKLAILGDMLEMGEHSYEEHHHIKQLVMNLNIDEVIFVGEEFKAVTKKAMKDYKQVRQYLEENPKYKNFLILIKGSRGVSLEKIFD